MLDLAPIKARARASQAAEFMANAVDDIDALVEEVDRLRRQREVDQAQIRAYEKALTWYALPENWREQVDDRGRETLSFRWADDDGHMAQHALNTWRQSAGAKKVENNSA
jgi:hypothetical protein